jgi:hypothetical protein
MRRLSGFLLAGAMLVLPAFAQPAVAQAAPPKFTIDGEVAVLSVSVNAAKTADYEQVLNKLKEVLSKSEAPEAKQQAAGWQIVKALKPMPDGNVIYMHIIKPVPGADYSVLQSIYAVVKDPTEQKALYDLYVGAGAKNLSLVAGTVAVDLGK